MMSRGAAALSSPLLRPAHRVLSWTRLALAVQALAVNLIRLDHVSHPGVLVGISVLILLWTWVMAAFNRFPPRVRLVLTYADLVLALVLVLLTPWVVGRASSSWGFMATSVYWQASAALATAVVWSSWHGLAMAFVLGVACVFGAGHVHDAHAWATAFTICLASWAAGQMVDQQRRAIVERDRSLAASVALAERDRMNRIVHDGALQVLSLVEREGASLGPRGERLAMLARQQEVQLRSVLQDRTYVDEEQDRPDEVDVTAMLDAMSSDRVTVSLMAGSVMLPTEIAAEVKGALAQILLNTELHAGPDAQTWILLEDDGERLLVSVRDNGIGMTREQIQAAFDAGRLGIRHSIIGRLRDIGGTAEVSSEPGRGVEWELGIPTRGPWEPVATSPSSQPTPTRPLEPDRD